MATENITLGSIERLRHNLRSFGSKKSKRGKRGRNRDWYERYREELRRYRNQMADTICEINGLKPDDVGRSVDIMGVVTLQNKNNVFFDKSRVSWDGNSRSFLSKRKEKSIRFLTFFLIGMNDCIEDLVDSLTAKRPDTTYEYEYRTLIDIEYTIGTLVDQMVTGKKYNNTLLRILTKLEYLVEGVNHKKFNKKVVQVIQDLKTGLNSSQISDMINPLSNLKISIPEDLGIDGIIKLAYMLRTGTSNLKDLPRFEELEGCTLEYDLQDIFKALGNAVAKKEPNIIYRSWEISDLSVNQNVDNPYVDGINTLKFCSFILADKGITKFIDKMLSE